MKNRFLLSLAVIASAMLATSCEKGGDDGGKNGGNTYGEVSKIDIVGAKYLYSIASGGTTRGSILGEENLYKIITNGETHEVKVTDENGNELPVYDIAVSSLTKDYIAMTFCIDTVTGVDEDGESYGEQKYYFYFINKNTGELSEIPTQFQHSFFDLTTRPIKAKPVITDKFQNVYIAIVPSLYRISLTNGGSYESVTGYDIPTDYSSYRVDYLGNIIYRDHDDNLIAKSKNGNKTLMTMEIQYPANLFMNNELIGFPKRENGGFFCYIGYTGYYEINIDESGNANFTRLDGFAQDENLYYNHETYMMRKVVTLGDKLVSIPHSLGMSETPTRSGLIADNSIVIIRSDFSKTTITDDRIKWSNGAHTKNHIYWYDDQAIYEFDAITEQITIFYEFVAGTTYNKFSFTDDLAMFYIKRGGETYLCEIRDGVYKEGVSESGRQITGMIFVN